MKLLVIGLCLAAERYFHLGDKLQRFTWFPHYVERLKSLLTVPQCWQSFMTLVTVISPIMLIVGISAFILGHTLLGFLFSIVVFLYCLGPSDLMFQLQPLLLAQQAGDEAHEQTELATFLPETPSEKLDVARRTATRHIFRAANDRLFAVIAWYVVFGLMGAVMYRVSSVLLTETHAEGALSDIKTEATTWKAWLDWGPVRLLGLLYALVGHFSITFQCWMQNVIGGPEHTDIILDHCSLSAMNLDPSTEAAVESTENEMALDQIDHATIIALSLLALFTLGGWLA